MEARLTTVSLIVHRAAHEIGGNCIEIASRSGARILLDAGRPLEAASRVPNSDLLPRTLDLSKPVDALLLSHPHQDHYGLLSALPTDWPVWSGVATEKLIRLSSALNRQTIPHRFSNWCPGEKFSVGPFQVTPILVDHSAFDAYMLLIEVDGRRILYSGDFRLHGRKGAQMRRFMAKPPRSLDVLIMEGTNLGSKKSHASEDEVEDRFCELFRRTPGRVFVSWSPQNVDRTVSLYKACLRAGRTFAIDLYTAEVMDALAGFGRLPKPGWRNIAVVITRRLRSRYARAGQEEFVDRMARTVGVSASALARSPSRWVIALRPSMIPDLESKGVRPDEKDAWSYSLWSGYLDRDDGRKQREWFESAGCIADHIHTSGHASTEDLRRFARAMSPRYLIPIHSYGWDQHSEGFENLQRLADGVAFTISG